MTGGHQEREVTYPVSKELVDKGSFEIEQDAYEGGTMLRNWMGGKEVKK